MKLPNKFTKKHTLLIAGSILLTSVIFLVPMPLLFEVKDISLFLSYSSALSGVATLLLAFLLLDRLDSNKVAFNKQAEAVDKLYTAILGTTFIFSQCKKPDNNQNKAEVESTAVFFLNFYNIAHTDPDEFANYPVYFSQNILTKLLTLTEVAHNPWLPGAIGRKLRPTFIYSCKQTYPIADLPPRFILVSSRDENYGIKTEISNVDFFEISYGEISLKNNRMLMRNFSSLLEEIKSWYNDSFDELPNLNGDFN